MRATLTRAGAVAAFVLAPAVASADRRDPTAAEALFRAARASVERGDYASACPKFEESNRLDPTVGTVFNLADCNEHVGKLASAWQLFKEAAQRFSTSDDRLAIANARAAKLEAKLPRMVLRDSALPRDAVVRRDGVQLGSASFGVPLPVDPGDHTVTVEMTGRATNTRIVHLDAGQSSEVPLEVGPALPVENVASNDRMRVATPPGASASSGGGASATWGALLLGVGGVGIASSLVLGGVALSEKSTVSAACVGQFCSDDGLEAARRGRRETTAASIAFGVGAVAAGLGTIVLLSGRSGRPAVTGALTPGHGFLTVTGTFH